jgi:hypothetical protein
MYHAADAGELGRSHARRLPTSDCQADQSTPIDELAAMNLPIRTELDRIPSVVEPRGEHEHRIHFVGDVTVVVANIWSWN